ncbi:aldehyde dehydrogenase [Rhodococcus opacus]|uniref:aldehyde dehydrogenase n=1 Tax=Rhodococcus opacus TaxID=37919 RepID=UPI002476EA01|nr:aldehyde dehydrogenase [Rhodococcus opacus]MDH6293305.1 aldehyde dehydrogenase (NAD+) [Rhodococcus opacus]
MVELHQKEILIGGRFVSAAGSERYDIVSPFTEEVIGSVPVPTEGEMRQALEAAHRAFEEGPWPRMAAEERADAIDRLASELRERAQETAELFSFESGTPVKASAGLGNTTDIVFKTYADLARTFAFRERREWFGGELDVYKEPAGVVVGIAPWNGPIPGISHSLAPALAAGCTIVIKPAVEASLAVRFLSEAVEAAGFPEGVISIMPGDGAVGTYLNNQPEVNKIAFTGSTPVGKAIMRLAADRLVRVTLELGGKGPAILCDDADISALAPTIVQSGLALSGQVCAAQTRILVPRSRKAEFVDALKAAAKALKVGDPMSPDTDLGPLSTARQRDRVEEYIRIARDEGARVALGGGRPAGLDRGWFVEPTIFDNVDNSMRIAQEEVFGPVLAVIAYDGPDDDAVRIANDSKYGLNASVWSSDTERATKIAGKLRHGQIHINGFGTCPGQPFGGFKESGIGRKGGVEGLESYLETKVVQTHG